ncbi:MAG: shikimate dehydrogenase [Anaerolineae bacterium]|nr:shikimate dehydrogenase [Anaerolineae bacterium]
MDSFAFIIHPIDPKRDVTRKYPVLGKILPEPTIHFLSRFWPPVRLSHVTGARSMGTGKEIEGWLIAVPYTTQRMLTLPAKEVYRKIIAAGRLAESLGAKILGLGAYTSVIGDGGRTIANALDIAVTSGDSYTAAISVYATQKAARLMEIDLAQSVVAVVGAGGAIGQAVSQLLAPSIGRMILIGRQRESLELVVDKVHAMGCADVVISEDVSTISTAEVVLTVTSSGGNLIQPEMLRRGAVVCDVSRPRDVSWQVSRARDDVLVIDGGLVRVPGKIHFGFDYGLPADLTYGCFAETMTLAFEGLFEDYSVGKDLSLEKVRQIDALATHHGFELAALRSFEKKLDESLIEKIKAKVQR